MNVHNYFLIGMFLFLTIGCQVSHQEDSQVAVGPGGWLKGNSDEKFDEVAHQLGGFSRTMVEVGYRYSELYWAGQDENWKYAEHQIEHILEAMEDGLKRRPERKPSSTEFMEEVLPKMEELVDQGDKAAFLEGFKTFTASCNQCHNQEGEEFIVIREPQERTSPVRFR
ncbi:hypothetical protein [Pleomorphovibrio marinus]|uniref:hypothetical protein n=1 Tax=Pleomorphovibrio marinus TaxID=2164132 RepID=UPI000E0C8E71|nr:hypothetical protein [Pleomorphovibrio marinus]